MLALIVEFIRGNPSSSLNLRCSFNARYLCGWSTNMRFIQPTRTDTRLMTPCLGEYNISTLGVHAKPRGKMSVCISTHIILNFWKTTNLDDKHCNVIHLASRTQAICMDVVQAGLQLTLGLVMYAHTKADFSESMQLDCLLRVSGLDIISVEATLRTRRMRILDCSVFN